MRAELAIQIERIAATAASLSLGAACAFATYVASTPVLADVGIRGAAAAIVGVMAFVAGHYVLRSAGSRSAGEMSGAFEAVAMPVEEGPDELLLTDVFETASQHEDALVLDDILAELEPNSRVVRLFDRASMPSPGQLKSRIDAHLGRVRQDAPAPPDASQALHEALAELRRSMG